MDVIFNSGAMMFSYDTHLSEETRVVDSDGGMTVADVAKRLGQAIATINRRLNNPSAEEPLVEISPPPRRRVSSESVEKAWRAELKRLGVDVELCELRDDVERLRAAYDELWLSHGALHRSLGLLQNIRVSTRQQNHSDESQ
jgi:hypothetical protein